MPKGVPKSGLNKGWFKKKKSLFKGMTYEERFGTEKALEIRQKQKANHRGMSGKRHKKATIEKIRQANSNPPMALRTLQSELKKGSLNPMWGKTLSEDHRAKLREASIRNKCTPPHKKGKDHWNWGGGDYLRGEKSPNWKGGVTKPHEKIRKSVKYKNWRTSVFERDDYTCQFCKKRGVKLNADHIKPFSLFPDLRLDINNGRTLCLPCHRKTDTWGTKVNNYFKQNGATN